MKYLSVDEDTLCNAANRLISRFIEKEPPFEIFTELNEVFLRATESEYGFIARVFKNNQGPFIKTLAVSNIAWNDETRKLYAENAERGMIFDNLETIFGQVLKTGKTYVSLDAPNDPNAAGIPVGHPKLNRFLGVPLVRDDVLIGMLGLANGSHYGDALVGELRPLLGVTTQIIHGCSLQENLVADGHYYLQPNAIIDSIRSGVISVDQNGDVLTANPSAAIIFGYTREEVVGLKIQTLIPPVGTDDLYDHRGVFSLRPDQLGSAFEATGAKKAGSFFPVEATCDVVESGASHSYAFVIRDLTEEKKTERLKNEFISIISHELRTPLTAVQTALAMLANTRHRPDSEAEVEDLTQIAYRNCNRLGDLVNDILDYEKLNAGKIDFQFGRTDLATIFEIAKDSTGLLAKPYNIQLRFSYPESPIYVAADANRIAQVLVNLIANAIRFSDEGQDVTIGFAIPDEESRVRLFVQDYGSGIANENLRHVFEPFVQLSNHPGGAGLGLAICKRIVESHEGRIVCSSTFGEGTIFYFDLYRYFEIDDKANSDPLQQKTILWVESDSHFYELATQGIPLTALRIVRVENGQLAKQQLNQNSFDMLVLSHPMAIESTEQFVTQVRALQTYQDLPIVVYSNNLSVQTREVLEAFDVDCRIRKSWKVEQLQQKIVAAVGSN